MLAEIYALLLDVIRLVDCDLRSLLLNALECGHRAFRLTQIWHVPLGREVLAPLAHHGSLQDRFRLLHNLLDGLESDLGSGKRIGVYGEVGSG